MGGTIWKSGNQELLSLFVSSRLLAAIVRIAENGRSELILGGIRWYVAGVLNKG